VLARIGTLWIAVGVLLLTACGGSSSSDSGATDSEQTQDATAGAGNEVGREEFGMTEEQLVTSIENVESLIASCMADAGFEYVPIDPVTFQDAMSSLGNAPGLSDEEFIAQYGYGFTTLPPTQDFGAGEENASIFNDLPSADQVAYQRALLGDDINATFVVGLEVEDFSNVGGCTKTAIEQVFTEEQLSPTFFNPFDAQVEADPRMVAANENWSGCMRDAGYDFERPDDAEKELRDRLDAITEGGDPATLTGTAKDALTDLQGEERAIAQVDSDCQDRFLHDVEQQVERDISGRG
jgi:hypothetical protein